MLCSICKKNQANLHVKNNINGVITDKYICRECYDKMLGNVYYDSISKLINSMHAGGQIKEAPKKACSVCGTKLHEISDTFYAGCPACYRELYDDILPVIKNVQNAIVHQGKRPLNAEETIGSEYERLKNELNKAIEQENYEQAAIISARLKQLRGESND